ncbi:MAG: hypothetical protein ACK518_04010 [bacterium]
MSDYYELELDKLQEEMGCSREEVIHKLIDVYNIQTPMHLSIIYQRLSYRIQEGINRAYLERLKILYTYLGHIFTKTGILCDHSLPLPFPTTTTQVLKKTKVLK